MPFLVGEAAAGAGPTSTEGSPSLRIHVVFTTPEETRAALQHAEKLSAGLNSEIALIMTQIVPFPLALDQPPSSLDLAHEQIRRMADCIDREVVGYILLCRDPKRLLESALIPHSLIIMGLRRRWGFSRTERLARALRRRGHEVILRGV